ncbi:MAG: hypothetical protein GX443_07615 [Deltaproteobacteria bacterium]|nr:hypothetical protein [Deltaproteobacteria bacterium]
MELVTRTADGAEVRFAIERDRNSVHQVYAYLTLHGETVERRLLCSCWGRRRHPEGLREGILAGGQVLQVTRAEWLKLFHAREDFRGRDNLKDIHLVHVFSRGERVNIDGYTLSARMDRETWNKISPFMEEVDSWENDVLYDGDRFTGWIVKRGMEGQVEEILRVKPEYRLFPR